MAFDPNDTGRAENSRYRSERARVISPLPVREGVSASYIWLPDGEWPSLLSFLIARFPDVAEAIWKSRMARGEVVNAQGLRMCPDSAYRRGECIFYYRELGAETRIPFEETILFQDDQLLVADKPHFLPVIPSGRFLHETLLVRLKKKTGISTLTPIHRLDRETAGVIVFSVDPATRGEYQSLFQKREVRKVYEAVARRLPADRFPMVYRSRMKEGQPFFRMEETEGIANAETWIEMVEARGEHALYRLRPLTGKKHQLRVHLAALGMPILHDGFYPDVLPCKENDTSSPLQLLSRAIAFQDPVKGITRHFESQRQLELPECASQ